MNMHDGKKDATKMIDRFVDEYNSKDAILRYSRRSAGYGINYLLQKDYANVYLKKLRVKSCNITIVEKGLGFSRAEE